MKHVKAKSSLPLLPPRRKLPHKLEDPGFSGWGVFAFPPQHKLIITTTRGVFVWDIYGVTEIFRSGSEGIVAAKKLTSGDEMLAVADSQVVVLHDIKGGTKKSYRLKGSEGRIRLLKYAKESDHLFFTTELQNSVQSYSLRDSILQDTSHNHPTPPTVFALSCNSQFLLSTSIAPPTIHLTDLWLNMLPVLVRPQCSSSAVLAAAFHPERMNYFLLAFADGTAAVLDTTHFFGKYDKRDHGARAAVSGAGGMLAFIKGLHAQGTSNRKVVMGSDPLFDGYDPGTGVVGVGDKSTGITAVAFVPGRKATVVTVGADGKCCIVDFTQSTKKQAILLKTWHVRRPATSLSIICSAQKSTCGTLGQVDGINDAAPTDTHDASSGAYYIAIGRQDGRVLLFDLNGKMLGEQTLDEDGARIIDVEWTQVEDKNKNTAGASRKFTDLFVPGSSSAEMKLQDLGATVQTQSRPVQPKESTMRSSVDKRLRDSLFDFSTPRKAPGIPTSEPLSDEPVKGANHLDMVLYPETSSEETSADTDSSYTSLYVLTNGSNRMVQRKPVLSSPKDREYRRQTYASSVDESGPPPIPPRPSPKPGGRLSMRRAHTTHQAPAEDSYISMVSNARKARTSQGSKPKVFFGPRKTPSPKLKRSNAVIAQGHTSPAKAEHGWLDVPPEPPQHGLQLSPKSPATSEQSYTTAASQLNAPSDSSSETVIDWDAGLPRQALPSLLKPQLTHDRVTPNKPKQKGHISLSVSSASRESETSISSASATRTTTNNQWPASPTRNSVPSLHVTHPSGEMPARRNPNPKSHISIPPSSVSDNTITQASSASSGPVIQWPSLKKSPRIPELNKALSENERESPTGIVLDSYFGSPSPAKTPDSNVLSINGFARESHTYNYTNKIESVLTTYLSALRMEMVQKFEEQKIWLEALIKSEDKGRDMLVEENRLLRAELARLGKEKEEKKGERKSFP